ncbi:MAG: hypothetical protein KJ955_05465 [Nanoarchaeota archaeon]|nr:hypothetical protein [Nanoarchaeota archaeon]
MKKKDFPPRYILLLLFPILIFLIAGCDTIIQSYNLELLNITREPCFATLPDEYKSEIKSHNLWFDNITKSFKAEYEGSKYVKGACLTVNGAGFGNLGKIICKKCIEGSSGKIECPIGDAEGEFRTEFASNIEPDCLKVKFGFKNLAKKAVSTRIGDATIVTASGEQIGMLRDSLYTTLTGCDANQDIKLFPNAEQEFSFCFPNLERSVLPKLYVRVKNDYQVVSSPGPLGFEEQGGIDDIEFDISNIVPL